LIPLIFSTTPRGTTPGALAATIIASTWSLRRRPSGRQTPAALIWTCVTAVI
jgi:hypothetical protein